MISGLYIIRKKLVYQIYKDSYHFVIKETVKLKLGQYILRH